MKRKRRRKTLRVYYGVNKYTGKHFDWTVPFPDARRDVVMKGTLADAMMGKAGQTIGCHLSHAAARNRSLFPHGFEFAAFTKAGCSMKSTVGDCSKSKPGSRDDRNHHIEGIA